MTDEEFFAWLDGELDDADANRVAAAVAANPALQARADAHRTMMAGLRGAFQPVVNADVQSPTFGAEVVPLAPRKATNENHRWRFGLPQWGAMAASLALGLLVAPFIRGNGGQPFEAHNGTVVAAAGLEKALDTQLASLDQSGPVRIGITFRDKKGQICRSFNGDAGSGLACRGDKGWTVDGLFSASPSQSGDYRMAAGEDPRLAALIDANIAGEPLDAAGEKAAKDAGWR